MNIKKIVAAVLLISLAFCFFACGEKSPLEIADENGEEDHSLAVLTLTEISAKKPKHFCKEFGIGIPEDQSSIDGSNEFVASASSPFSGVAVLQKTECTEDKITFTVTSERKKGNMRIMLMDDKMNVLHDFKLGETSVYEIENAKGKKYEIRIACESAEFSITAERTFG